jgi:integrase
MAGSIRQRPDRGPETWELRIYLGRDGSGRVRHRSVTFHGTRRAAERELARLLTRAEAEPVVIPDESSRAWGPSTTFNDAIAGWRDNGWADLSPLTVARYESVWKLHIRDGIGKRRIAETGPYDVERYFRQLKAAGTGRETVRYVRATLHRACRLARKWSGNTLPNPITDTELPSWGTAGQSEPVRSPSVEEVVAVLRGASVLDPRYRIGMFIVAATGMRRGEVCGLRWRDVDFDNSALVVDESVIAAEGGAGVKAPKTRASVRRIAIDTGTLDLLAELRREQEALAAVAEVPLLDHGFLLSTEPGGLEPLHPDTLSKAFAKARKSAGVAVNVHLHSLRHFQATTLDNVISEKQKQSRLGWATVHMARHYTDAIAEEDRRAAEHVGRVLAESREPQETQ